MGVAGFGCIDNMIERKIICRKRTIVDVDRRPYQCKFFGGNSYVFSNPTRGRYLAGDQDDSTKLTYTWQIFGGRHHDDSTGRSVPYTTCGSSPTRGRDLAGDEFIWQHGICSEIGGKRSVVHEASKRAHYSTWYPIPISNTIQHPILLNTGLRRQSTTHSLTR